MRPNYDGPTLLRIFQSCWHIIAIITTIKLQYNVVHAHCFGVKLVRPHARAWVVFGDTGSGLGAARVVTNATCGLKIAIIIAFLNALSI